MTDEEFLAFCNMGKHQREVTMGVDMMPILVLMTDNGTEIHGLALEPSEWPRAFDAFRKERHPSGAVLTADIFYRDIQPGQVVKRPKDDPAASNALCIMGVARDQDMLVRVIPYVVNDDGTITWQDARSPAGLHGPVETALLAMVQK